ncbi:hypothetical protein [Natronosalvus rutilus]|uniref:DUF8159 domain-containing protein n=1 Tax=Natronosalvus rutilus TaxID=2953753 RepID=A0A9E7NDL5_9EURY|nr:hypothetical protein [Natronosalvus rutilus]UTF55386.1 hypothetical protein NGM29_09100 [Natronosalvus rutilus]
MDRRFGGASSESESSESGRNASDSSVSGWIESKSTESESSTSNRISRRTALGILAVGVSASLAGCTQDVGEELPPNKSWPIAELVPDLPITKRTDVFAAGIESIDDEITDEEAFAEALEAEGLEVESLERERDVLTLEYVNRERYETGTIHELGPITGAYAALVDAGYDAVALAITILDDAPESYGSATVESAWAERYVAGDLTAAEYGELVAGTIDSRRHPPFVGVSPEE